MLSRIGAASCLLTLLTLAACGGESPQEPAAARPVAAYDSALIRDVPHVRQKPDFCGEACAEMYLRKLGYNLTQDDVFDRSGLAPSLGRGCYTRELAKALQAVGFNVGRVWNPIAAARADKELEEQFRALHADLVAGVPSIVCTHYDERPDTTEHFRLVIGYDARTDEVIYQEPAVNDGAVRRMSRARLLKLWPLKYAKDRWTVVRLRLAPGQIRDVRPAKGFTSADFAQHVMRLKTKLPSEAFTVVVQPPFVVVGDEAADVVRRRSQQTVKWAVDHLKQTYFERDPEHILDIWLFKDKASYDQNTRRVFNDRPTTPFGYYSATNRALVMNIATGGGTLVHEIVHPFMASNFPACPSWFNEGLASLYEQSGERDGRICGFTNWRLPGLQKAIGADKVPSFATLCATSTREFYNEDPGTNYSQARYLCYYLQEKKLLAKYYHEFRKSADQDPTGYETLKRVLGERDLDAFKKRWERFVLALRRD